MRKVELVLVVCLAATLSCQALSVPVGPVTGTEAAPSMPGGSEVFASPEPSMTLPLTASPAPIPGAADALLIPVDQPPPASLPPHVSRSRYVKVNLDLLLKANGQPRNLPPGHEIVVNLFPDVVYTGIIDSMESQGDGGSWTGTLKDVEYSSMFMVYTAGVFMGHYASPLGIYEVSTAGGDLYRVDLIDQNAFPGGD